MKQKEEAGMKKAKAKGKKEADACNFYQADQSREDGVG